MHGHVQDIWRIFKIWKSATWVVLSFLLWVRGAGSERRHMMHDWTERPGWRQPQRWDLSSSRVHQPDHSCTCHAAASGFASQTPPFQVSPRALPPRVKFCIRNGHICQWPCTSKEACISWKSAQEHACPLGLEAQGREPGWECVRWDSAALPLSCCGDPGRTQKHMPGLKPAIGTWLEEGLTHQALPQSTGEKRSPGQCLNTVLVPFWGACNAFSIHAAASPQPGAPLLCRLRSLSLPASPSLESSPCALAPPFPLKARSLEW